MCEQSCTMTKCINQITLHYFKLNTRISIFTRMSAISTFHLFCKLLRHFSKRKSTQWWLDDIYSIVFQLFKCYYRLFKHCRFTANFSLKRTSIYKRRLYSYYPGYLPKVTKSLQESEYAAIVNYFQTANVAHWHQHFCRILLSIRVLGELLSE